MVCSGRSANGPQWSLSHHLRPVTILEKQVEAKRTELAKDVEVQSRAERIAQTEVQSRGRSWRTTTDVIYARRKIARALKHSVHFKPNKKLQQWPQLEFKFRTFHMVALLVCCLVKFLLQVVLVFLRLHQAQWQVSAVQAGMLALVTVATAQ
ncbi:unnamed protein product, partial [Prorocentrum cordatum]